MIDLSVADVSARTMLWLVVWADVGFAGAMMLGVLLWLVGCWFETRRRVE